MRKTAKQVGVALSDGLKECQGCSMMKGHRPQIKSCTATQPAKPGASVRWSGLTQGCRVAGREEMNDDNQE